MKKMIFVFNPKSGKEQIRSKLLDILDVFTKYGYDVSVHVTQKPEDAIQVVKQRAGECELLVCSGGDGTLNEVVSGLMEIDVKRRPVLGYIPSGSTNDYASSIGISKNMEKAALDAVSGGTIAVDVGKFGEDRYFVYVAAFGAFTEVSYSTPQETKNLLGHQAYMLEAVKRVTNLKAYKMKFEWDGKVLEDEFIIGMITNTISIGGFKGLVGLDVALDDGEFEVLLVKKPKAPKDIASIASYLILREGENDCVHQFRAKNIKVTSPEPVDWSLDGEYGGSRTETVIENLNRAVSIRHKAPSVVEAL